MRGDASGSVLLFRHQQRMARAKTTSRDLLCFLFASLYWLAVNVLEIIFLTGLKLCRLCFWP
jgi:hypothetical protein